MSTAAIVQREPRMRYRLVRASDRAAIRAFFARLSPDTVRSRYFSSVQLSGPFGERELARLLDDTRDDHVVVVAKQGIEVRGIAEFVAEEARRGEFAVVVEDAFQGRRVGRWLMRRLRRAALQRGIDVFTGDVAYGNARATALLRRAGRLRMQLHYGSMRFSLELSTPAAA
jgi:acetyltransferase